MCEKIKTNKQTKKHLVGSHGAPSPPLGHLSVKQVGNANLNSFSLKCLKQKTVAKNIGKDKSKGQRD